MRYTFAITTDFSNEKQLNEVIESIRQMQLTYEFFEEFDHEILVIGGKEKEDDEEVRYIYFDESEKPGWVTRKKNILVQEAKFENIVLMHDYFLFDEKWLEAYERFGDDWEICSNPQLLFNGKRHFTDWVTWDSPIYPRYTALPYDEWSMTKYMYQSGGYMVVKKYVLNENPFNENLVWGQADDVEWSLRVRDRYKWVCNPNAIVRHNKVHRDAE